MKNAKIIFSCSQGMPCLLVPDGLSALARLHTGLVE
jgi:hypothetical protein